MGQAISYFTSQGYIVSLPINDSQAYDLIIEKDMQLQTVQVKYTSEKSKGGAAYKCTLRTISGTTRQKLYSITDTGVNLLFCYCDNGEKYLIPVKDITNSNSITLSTVFAKQGFDTSKYVI